MLQFGLEDDGGRKNGGGGGKKKKGPGKGTKYNL
jgi:hypothetical protein